MKSFFLFIILITTVTLSIGGGLISIPYFYYNKIINKDYSNEWYSNRNFNKEFVRASESEELYHVSEKNPNLWGKFHFMDLIIPLPVKNPFYFVAPEFRYRPKKKQTDIGLSIYSADNKIISKIYFLQNKVFPKFLDKQKLFELPIVKRELIRYKNDKIWKDVFTKDIRKWNIPYSEMVYNLYLLEFRIHLLKLKFKKYYLFKDSNIAVVELVSENKDYTNDLVMTKKGNIIYSYIISTHRRSVKAEQLRHKLISEIDYVHSNPNLADIIYQEFKSLNYEDQIDHKGMLYLFSAWTHNTSRRELIELNIFNLERGRKNQRQLEPFYKYMHKRYNKLYTNKFVDGVNISDEMRLNRNIELENKKQKNDELKRIKERFNSPEVKQTFGDLIREAKKNKTKSKDSIHID